MMSNADISDNICG